MSQYFGCSPGRVEAGGGAARVIFREVEVTVGFCALGYLLTPELIHFPKCPWIRLFICLPFLQVVWVVCSSIGLLEVRNYVVCFKATELQS